MSDEIAATSRAVANSRSSSAMWFARVGTWFLVAPPGPQSDNLSVVAEVVDGLRADSRVLEVLPPEMDKYWTRRGRIYPDRYRTSVNGLAVGNDGINVLQLASLLRFKVRVPIKNQPMHHDADDIPTDTYWVAWNGLSIFVLWEQDEEWVPLSGGHVVRQVLEDVLEHFGAGLYVQSCSPECDFGFLHTPVRIVADARLEPLEFRLSEAPHGRHLEYTTGIPHGDPMRSVDFLGMDLQGAVDDFAMYKNAGRRMIDIDWLMRDDLTHLLSHYHAHTGLVSKGYSPKALWRRWRARSWRREAWSLISGIWLSMTNLETMRAKWSEERTSMLSESDVVLLLRPDFFRDEDRIAELRSQQVAETVNQVAGSLNNRMAVTATVWGALAGGVAGGLAGILGH